MVREGKNYLQGRLELPMSVGTKGGVINNNQVYLNNLSMLGMPSAQKLSELIVTVGLANNFAALKALAVEGIQKGHMSLHSKNIALQSGVPTYLVDDCVLFMKDTGNISTTNA